MRTARMWLGCEVSPVGCMVVEGRRRRIGRFVECRRVVRVRMMTTSCCKQLVLYCLTCVM